ncbi:Oxidoreductase, aldo/keto reductase family [Lunatimonas lonarensis]|uniref:Oxidoreductase, aldo/keto reductase family n=1 Tax=Lunatimonas lonarensis TaxID=1232681 RepID=R7ZWA4_9BACT|nr:aldo/keto reductase [Lunatimonas lonarensis]EON78298.1 Oxidoreductase, aldo/keto reductase family [Lunatimonas lonarensis]
METTLRLPHSDFEISRIIFGCWAIVGGFNWGPQDERDSIEALKAAYDSGISTFDTAEAYGGGQSENLLAKALKGERHRIVIASKVGPQDFAYADLIQACERGLKNLQTDYIDLYQLHWPNPAIPLDETLGALQVLKDQGKIRAYGVSNFGVKSLTTCAESAGAISSNQMAYNLLFRAIEYEILPKCIESDIPVLCYSPIMQGLLTGKFSDWEQVPDDRARTRHFSSKRPQSRHQEEGCEGLTFETIAAIRRLSTDNGMDMGSLSLAWLLRQPGVGGVIVGGRNAEQARRNTLAYEVSNNRGLFEELSGLTEELKEKLGSNADLWQTDSRVI